MGRTVPTRIVLSAILLAATTFGQSSSVSQSKTKSKVKETLPPAQQEQKVKPLKGPVTGISAANFPGLLEELRSGLAESKKDVVIQMLHGSGENDAGITFSKIRVVIKAGSRITFFNADESIHNMVSDNGEFSTPKLMPGEKYSFVLNKRGTYPYHCIPHPWMKGTIIVK